MGNQRLNAAARLAAFSLALLITLALNHPAKAVAREAECKKAAAIPLNPIYRGLKNVSIYVRVTPVSYLKAIECHEHEDQCANEHGAIYRLMKPPEGWREGYVKSLKSEYDAFPKILYPQTLSGLLAKIIKGKLAGYVTTEGCQPPNFAVLDEKSFHAFEAIDEQGQSDKDTLTIVVQIRMVENFNPRIALLSTNFYRPSAGLRSQLIENDALILPLEGGDLQETIKKWADNFVRIWAGQ